VALVRCEGGVWCAARPLPLHDLKTGVEAKLVAIKGWRQGTSHAAHVEWEGGKNRLLKVSDVPRA
jgi:hypothetical protein